MVHSIINILLNTPNQTNIMREGRPEPRIVKRVRLPGETMCKQDLAGSIKN